MLSLLSHVVGQGVWIVGSHCYEDMPQTVAVPARLLPRAVPEDIVSL